MSLYAETEKMLRVYAENGLGIYTNYDSALRAKEYLSKFRIKKFFNLQEAKLYAVQGYNQYQIPDDYTAHCKPDLLQRLNWILYRKAIRENNERSVENE